jgi:hypothetical protein
MAYMWDSTVAIGTSWVDGGPASASRNIRSRLYAADINNGNDGSPAQQVRVILKGHATQDIDIDGCSIGTTSNGIDYTGDQVRIKFSGSNSGTIPSGSTLTSDWVDFDYADTDNILVHFYIAGNEYYSYLTETSGAYREEPAGADDTMTTDIGSYSGIAALYYVEYVEERDKPSTTTTSTTATTTTSSSTSVTSSTTTTTIPLGLYTDNFSVGSPLDNWTEYWLESNFTQTIAASTETAKVGSDNLYLANSASQRSVLTFDTPGGFDDGEVLALVNLDDNAYNWNYPIRVGLRISGSNGSENAYFCDIRGQTADRVGITRLDSGASTELGSVTLFQILASSVQHWVRFRVNGTSLKAKIWEYRNHEPDEWQIETTDSNLTSGLSGLGIYDITAHYYCEYFAVDSSGGTVPVPALTAGTKVDRLSTQRDATGWATTSVNWCRLIAYPVPSGLNGKYLKNLEFRVGTWNDNVRIGAYIGSDVTDATDGTLVEDFGVVSGDSDSWITLTFTASQQVSTGDVIWVMMAGNDNNSEFLYADCEASGQGQLNNGYGRHTTSGHTDDETTSMPANLSGITHVGGIYWYMGSVEFDDSAPGSTTTTTTSSTTTSSTTTTATSSTTTTYPPYANNNDFSNDSYCKALWRFESGALGTDSKGGNTLTPTNSPSEDTTNEIEGSCCVDLANTNDEYLVIANASLDSGFPCQTGDSDRLITVTAWIRSKGYLGWQMILGSATYTYASREGIGLGVNSSKGLYLHYGHDGGTGSDHDLGKTLTDDVWYHVALKVDGVNRTWAVRIWGEDKTLHTDNGNTAAYDMELISTADWCIGKFEEYNTQYTFHGKVDEVAVFDRLLSDEHIDDIRKGVYDYSSATTTTTTTSSTTTTTNTQSTTTSSTTTTNTQSTTTSSTTTTNTQSTTTTSNTQSTTTSSTTTTAPGGGGGENINRTIIIVSTV